MDQLDLSAFFKTKAQANDFSVRIGTVAEQVFQTNFNIEQALTDEFGMQKKDLLMAMIRDNKIILSGTPLKEFLVKLQELALSLPVLSITVAFEPKEQTLKAISEWFLLNIHKQILLDVIVDTNVVAGAIISFKGKYLDFSVKPVFERVLSEAVQKLAPAAGTPSAASRPASPHPVLLQSAEHMTIGR